MPSSIDLYFCDDSLPVSLGKGKVHRKGVTERCLLLCKTVFFYHQSKRIKFMSSENWQFMAVYILPLKNYKCNHAHKQMSFLVKKGLRHDVFKFV